MVVLSSLCIKGKNTEQKMILSSPWSSNTAIQFIPNLLQLLQIEPTVLILHNQNWTSHVCCFALSYEQVPCWLAAKIETGSRWTFCVCNSAREVQQYKECAPFITAKPNPRPFWRCNYYLYLNWICSSVCDSGFFNILFISKSIIVCWIQTLIPQWERIMVMLFTEVTDILC